MRAAFARLFRFPLSLLAVLGIVAVNSKVMPVNATTAALYMLIVVLAVATRWGMVESIFVSFAGVLAFNFYFLPPVGTFTIDDPENWVALGAFLVTAITASKLSTDSRRRAREALAGRNLTARLYELSRALLMEDGPDSVAQSVLRAGQILQIDTIAFYEAGGQRIFGNAAGPEFEISELAQVAETGVEIERPGTRVLPVRIGNTTLGSLAISGPPSDLPVTRDLRESTANLLAINYERAISRERATAAEAGRRNEEFKTALLDGLAHDLKTPLTAIRTCVTSLLTIPGIAEEPRLELLGIIDSSSLRLQASITEAIELAKIESRELRLEKAWTPVHEIVEDAVASLGEDEASRFSVDVRPELGLHVDAGLVRRALSQILENAVKYSPQGSPVGVEAGPVANGVAIRIFDRGPGIDPSELDRVFEKFYRGRRVKGRTEGTGMGLAIAKGIIEAHGGRIRAENRQGGGTLVTIQLPDASE